MLVSDTNDLNQDSHREQANPRDIKQKQKNEPLRNWHAIGRIEWV